MEDLEAYWDSLTREQTEEQRVATLEWLREAKIPYTAHNKGLHLKITLGDELIDYWPTTGRIKRDNKFFTTNLNYLINIKQELS